LDFKDLSKPKAKKGSGKGVTLPTLREQDLGSILGDFIGEVHRLALFTGSFDSSLDFSPRLKSTSVNVGDTWQKTVGYSPQKKSGDTKSIVQRLDYNYVYKGQVTQNGKKYERVEADLALDTDLTQFISDAFGAEADQTGITKLPITLKAHIVWSLDPVTKDPVFAEATSVGGYSIFVKDLPSDVPALEETFKGRTTLSLTSRAPSKK
jgi:hypothetical protein